MKCRTALSAGGATATLISAILATVLAAVLATACSADTPAARPGSSGVTGELTVFAAASLTEAFTQIGQDFEAANQGTKITFNFAGSSALAAQINEGAPADVFAAASAATMKVVTDAGQSDGPPVVFARNQLVIAVPKGNPASITALRDLTNPGLKVALCAEPVPCGAAARAVLAAGGVELRPVTLEQDVRAALSKLRLGEVDAALVYRTDARAASSDVDGIEFPESEGATNDYLVVVVKDAPNRRAAAAFLAHLLTDRGRAALAAVGFRQP